jgi:hypothetical protein
MSNKVSVVETFFISISAEKIPMLLTPGFLFIITFQDNQNKYETPI